MRTRKLPRGETDRGIITDTAEWTDRRENDKETDSADCEIRRGSLLFFLPLSDATDSHTQKAVTPLVPTLEVLRCLWPCLVACCSRFATILIASRD